MRAITQMRFFNHVGRTMAESTSTPSVWGGPSVCPTLYVGSISGEVLMLLFFVLSTGGKVLAGCTSTALAWITILLTLWDVPSPVLVSSSQSMVSRARVGKTPVWVFSARATSILTLRASADTELCQSLTSGSRMVGVGYTETKSVEGGPV